MEKYISARKILFLKLSTILMFILVWAGFFIYFRIRKNKSLIYLLFFSLFYFYIFNVLNYTLFEFQSLIILKHFVPDLVLIGIPSVKSFNFIPLLTLSTKDAVTSLLNILLFVPFGFGLSLISKLGYKKIILLGMLLSVSIEFLQFFSGYVANITFRIADVNDVIFNTLGVAIGGTIFTILTRILKVLPKSGKILSNEIIKYITRL